MFGLPPAALSLLAGVSLCCAALATPVRASGVIYDNGESDRVNGWEMTQWVEADDFLIDTPTRLKGVKFWSNAVPGAFAGTIFWQIYSNSPNNRPGVVLFSGYSINPSHVETGFTLFGAYKEFITTFDIAPVDLAPGRYWLALHNGPETNVAPPNTFYWAATSNPGIFPSHVRAAGTPGPWFSNQFPGLPPELAFQVRGTPAPRIEAITRPTDGAKIRFTTLAGENYRVEYKNDLTETEWKRVPHSDTPGTGQPAEVSDQSSTGLARRFYRVVLL